MMWNLGEIAVLEPDEVADYLQVTGWRYTADYGKTHVWSRAVEGDDVEVLLPYSQDLRDYTVRMSELINTLAQVEKRSGEDILRELREPLVDVQQIRTMPDTPSGTTPLDEGARAIQGVRDLFLVAATSALLDEPPKASLPAGQRPKPAKDFLDQVRLGLPVAGSYVLRVETPVGGDLTREHPRTILRSLYGMVDAAHSAAERSARGGTPRPFEEVVAKGVSWNLCEALANIGGSRRSPFELTFNWARMLPVADPTPTLSFTRGQVRALHEGKAHLKKIADTVRATVVGQPSKLVHRDPELIGQVIFLDARVELPESLVESQWVSMKLPRSQYDQVVQVHWPERPAVVRATGQLKMVGKQWELVTVDELSIDTSG